MKKSIVFLLSSFVFGTFANNAFATDLVDVYQKALASDPTFKAANAQFLAARENIPIARAALLPQLNISGGIDRIFNDQSGFSPDPNKDINLLQKSITNQGQYSLSLSQQIFNVANWAALANAKASVKAAEASYSFSAQDLIMRAATAYFNVLQANDILKATQEKKKAVGEQLDQVKQKFDVGLTPITDVNNAEASYDTAIAEEIQNKNNLADTIEQLRAITGIQYKDLNSLTSDLPLLFPNPGNINRWVSTAEQQNYNLLAAHYNTISARENIITAQSGHTPIVNANGTYTYIHDIGTAELSSNNKNTDLGLSATLPIFAGGRTVAQTNQAEYLYNQALSNEELTHRTVTSQTRQDFLGIISLINKIKADKQEIISKQSALTSTLASYQAGLRTMVDVLNAETDLYNSQQRFAQDQYSYLIKTVQLKEDAGILSVDDIKSLNRWVQNKSIPVYDNSNHMLHPDGSLNHASINYSTSFRKNKILEKTNNQPNHNSASNKSITTIPKLDNKERYTIELISSENKNEVDTFVNSHINIKDKINSYSVNDAGKTFYKVTYGNYSSPETAQAALNKLPSNLKQHDAMIVSQR